MDPETDQTNLEQIVTGIEAGAPVARNADLPALTASAESRPEGVNNSETAETDSAGEPYDPAIHTKGRSKTKDGRWRKAPPGRPAGPGKAPAPAAKSTLGGLPAGHRPPAPAGEGVDASPGAAVSSDYRTAAIQVVAATVGIHAMVLGEDWLAQEPEMKMLVDATTAYFVATGQTMNLPPWIGLAGAYMAYAGGRFQKPKTVARLKTYWGKIRGLWSKYKPKVPSMANHAKSSQVESAPDYVAPVEPGWFKRAVPT